MEDDYLMDELILAAEVRDRWKVTFERWLAYAVELLKGGPK